MKLPALIKTTALLLSVVAGAYLLPSAPKTEQTSCITLTISNEYGLESSQLQCSAAPQQSWFAWFSGRSRSTQFHFIDLLELLNRFKH
jgi:hypothetical protein